MKTYRREEQGQGELVREGVNVGAPVRLLILHNTSELAASGEGEQSAGRRRDTINSMARCVARASEGIDFKVSSSLMRSPRLDFRATCKGRRRVIEREQRGERTKDLFRR